MRCDGTSEIGHALVTSRNVCLGALLDPGGLSLGTGGLALNRNAFAKAVMDDFVHSSTVTATQ